MREIVLDTETTGLDPFQGDRVIEIGCVELLNRMPTGQTFHRYLNPERSVPAQAFAVHGLSDDFLSDKPRFTEIVEELLLFIGEAPLIAHNALFDLGFLNAELERVGRPLIPADRLVDTLLLARRRHPAGPNSLNDLCLRFGIDNSRRSKHGALLDAELLADVYLELIGARQAEFLLMNAQPRLVQHASVEIRVRPQLLPERLTESEREAHLVFVSSLGENAIWQRYLQPPPSGAAAS